MCGRNTAQVQNIMFRALRFSFVIIFFFFQAEDGIRDADVTGVQTCALPIWNIAPIVPPKISFKLVFANSIERMIDRHAVQPGAEGGLAPESIQLFINLDEYLLGQVGRILLMMYKAHTGLENLLLVTFDQQAVGLLISPADIGNDVLIVLHATYSS